MPNSIAFRTCAASALACFVFAYCGPARAETSFGNVGMNARAFLAECEKGVKLWCSKQIYLVAIKADVDHASKNERSTFCVPPRGAGTDAERNVKVVAAVRGWFAQHPKAAAQTSDASVQILEAMQALWPGECPD